MELFPVLWMAVIDLFLNRILVKCVTFFLQNNDEKKRSYVMHLPFPREGKEGKETQMGVAFKLHLITRHDALSWIQIYNCVTVVRRDVFTLEFQEFLDLLFRQCIISAPELIQFLVLNGQEDAPEKRKNTSHCMQCKSCLLC